ncbi:MAG: GAF domain-containing protein [Alphaproteobacteria bacterium]
MIQLEPQRNGSRDRSRVVQQMLHEISQTILESADSNVLMDQILEKTLELGGFDIGMIRLFNPTSNALEPVSSRGYRDPENIERQRKRVEDPSSPRIIAQVIEHKRTKVEDLAHVEGMRTFKREGARIIVTVPLRTRDDVMGVMHLGNRTYREIESEEVRLLDAVGTQAGIAVQKIRLFEASERRAREQEALNVIARATSQSLDIKELFEIAAEKTAEVTGRQRVNFRLKDETTGHITVVAHRGFSEDEIENLRRKTSHPMLDEVFASGNPLVINGRDERASALLLQQTQSVAWIPVKSVAKVVGALGISDDQSRPFLPAEVKFLQAIGNVIGVAVENARLFGETQKNLERIRALHEIATSITSTLDLHEMLDLLLEKIDRVLPYSATAVRLLNTDTGVLETVTCRNIDKAEWKTESRGSGRGLPYQVLEEKVPLVVTNIQSDPRVRDAAFLRKYGLISYLGVPLMAGEAIFGVLSFFTKHERAFAAEEVEFLSALASQAAMAIHNAQLYEQTRSQAVELERSNQAKDELLLVAARQKEELSRLNAGLQREIAERGRAKAEVAARNRDLETLLYVTSHDLREPLRAIENFSRMVNERYRERLDDKGQDFLRRVILGSQRLNRLLDDILMLSRSQRMVPPTQEVDTKSMVEEAIKRLEEKIKTTKARVHIADGFHGLRVDKTWVTQAVYNLIANALKFTRNGDPPDVEVVPYEPESSEPDLVGISVRDRGPGIAPEHTERIFQLFQRAVGREVEGTGAGLAIVRQIAERHGGSAWVRPREGGGSEFIITFSRGKAPEGGLDP